MNYPESINLFVNSVADRALAYLIAIGAIGTLSMAVIQTGKDITPARIWFQQHFLKKWLQRKAATFLRHLDENPDAAAGTSFAEPSERQKMILTQTPERLAAFAEATLVRLSTGGDRRAFYDLTIEQLCGQANAAVQAAVDYPEKNAGLIFCLGAAADPRDLLLFTGPAPDEALRKQAQVDARARVSHAIQRALDALQIAAGFRWKLYMQAASFLLSYLFTIIGLSLFQNTSETTSWKHLGMFIFVGLAAGFLAPVARDLVATLQRARK